MIVFSEWSNRVNKRSLDGMKEKAMTETLTLPTLADTVTLAEYLVSLFTDIKVFKEKCNGHKS